MVPLEAAIHAHQSSLALVASGRGNRGGGGGDDFRTADVARNILKKMANIHIIHETPKSHSGDWQLCFQWCKYNYDDGTSHHGYRFIWRRPNGNLQAGRGQARLPSVAVGRALIQAAEAEGWGWLEGEGAKAESDE